MVPWSLRSGEQPNRVYARQMGLVELGFYWDTTFNGTADCIRHALIEISGSSARDLFNDVNVTRTWISLKHRYPLLGASTVEHPDGQGADFVVTESRLRAVLSHEINFSAVGSMQEARSTALSILNTERTLSNDLLGQLFILKRTDTENQYHVLLHIAHLITDGMGNTTILRTFLDTLSSTVDDHISDLEERLAMVPSAEDLGPETSSNVPRMRWKRAIACAIWDNRVSNLTGGHTLPRTVTSDTFQTAAQSCHTSTSFSPEVSTIIIATCRENRVTFGNAFPVVAHIALTRFLYKRYLRGEMSKQEWEYRKRQPLHTGGPLNLRPFLDKTWFKRGGGGELCVAISFYYLTLSRVPLGSDLEADAGDIPSLTTMLSRKQFFHRCNMVKMQVTHYIKHPLFYELSAAQSPGRVRRLKAAGEKWRNREEKGKDKEARKDIWDVTEGPVFTHGGSSFGNVDAILPLDYPLPATNPLSPRSQISHVLKAGFSSPTSPESSDASILHLRYSGTHLHCRPTELYLGADTTLKQLHLHVHWDGNVYQEGIVKEWLSEIRRVMEWYLGRREGS